MTRSVGELRIRALTAADWPVVEGIYAAGIATGNATFENEPPSWEDFDSSKLAEHPAGWPSSTAAWSAGSRAVEVSDRCVYVGMVEHSVFVDHRASPRCWPGAARRAHCVDRGGWDLDDPVGNPPENTASLALHELYGFRVIGVRERLGQHHGHWPDVVLVERRSTTAGR